MANEEKNNMSQEDFKARAKAKIAAKKAGAAPDGDSPKAEPAQAAPEPAAAASGGDDFKARAKAKIAAKKAAAGGEQPGSGAESGGGQPPAKDYKAAAKAKLAAKKAAAAEGGTPAPEAPAPKPTPKAPKAAEKPAAASQDVPARPKTTAPKKPGREYDRLRPSQRGVKEVFVWPNLVQIEMVGALTYILMLTVMAMFVRAPLLGLANPELTPNPAKAPWYFLGLQELLLHMHPALAGVILPTAVLIGLAAIPYFDIRPEGTGIWFSTPRGIPIAIFSAIYTMIWELALILVDEFLVVGEGTRGLAALLAAQGFPAFIGEVVVPVFFILFIPWSLAVLVKKRWKADTREVMIALFTFFLASFVLLTIIGTAFRGESMRLFWPWEIGAPHE